MSEKAAVEDRAVSDATYGEIGQISEQYIEEYSGGTFTILPQQKTDKQKHNMINSSITWMVNLLQKIRQSKVNRTL